MTEFYLEKSIIESSKAFNELIKIKSIPKLRFNSNSNIFKFEFSDSIDQKLLCVDRITSKENKITVFYTEPFKFYLEVDKIEKIKNFNECRNICLNNLNLEDNNLLFLNNETLSELEELNLDGNKITNLYFLKNIKSEKIKKISVEDNIISQGIDIINNNKNMNLINEEIKIKKYSENKFIISLYYIGKYKLNFDYLLDKDKNFDIFNNINFKNNSLILSGLKLNNIDFMLYKNMSNLQSIFLNNNNIEDISIFEKMEYHINKINLRNNSIRKGLHVLKSDYFKCLYIELDINKSDNEYKIRSDFILPHNKEINMEFFITDINELKNILDIKNTYIKLTNNDLDELKLLEKEFLQNQSEIHKKIFEKIISKKFFENHYSIYLIRDNNKSQILEYDELYINDNTNIILEKLFVYLQEKVDFYSGIDLYLKNLLPEDEKLVQKLSFIHMDKLVIIKCDIDLNILNKLHICSLDLSQAGQINIGINQLQELRKNIAKLSLTKDDENENKSCIIIDNGTSCCKIGFSGSFGPSVVIPTCVGYPKYTGGMLVKQDYDEYDKYEKKQKQYYIGSDIESKRISYKLNFPIDHGIVNSWNDIEKIWDYSFTEELGVEPKEHNIIVTEPPINPKENRERIAQIFFETFNVPGLYIANQAVLSLYSQGKNTGVVIESGEGRTYIVPIFDGFSLQHAIIIQDVCGEDLTDFMVGNLYLSDEYSTAAKKTICKNIKEKSCYVALNYEEEINKVEYFEYELPNGIYAHVKEARVRCPEILFKPSIINKEGNSIAQACFDSIQKCDIDIREELYNNIILSGGNTMFKGLSERLTKEIKILSPESIKDKIKVFALNERKFGAFIGGAFLPLSSQFESMLITKTEYEEFGATIVHRKCF